MLKKILSFFSPKVIEVPKPKSNIFYSVAHSGECGAISISGITENTLSKNAWIGFKSILTDSTYIDRPLSQAIVSVNSLCKKDDIAIQLHFNSTGFELCPCGKQRHIGSTCSCSNQSKTKIQFGTLCIAWNTHEKLCDMINNEILKITPFQKILKNQIIPDKTVANTARPNCLAWPNKIKCRSIIIECGFGCHNSFSNWIIDTHNQELIGVAVATGIKKFLESVP